MNVEINNRTKSRIDGKLIKEVCEIFLKKYKIKQSNLSIAFIGDHTMRKLNLRYRGVDKPTDILSFSDEDAGSDLGELLIDYQQIKRQAKQFSRGSTRQELIFILVHGLLHLLGRDDDTEKARLSMIKEGEEFIKNL